MDENLKTCVIFLAGGITSYLLVNIVLPKIRGKPKKGCPVNPNIKKDQAKVVDVFDIEDLPDKVAFCRCWKSSKFPYCDGSHNAHNKETGDNVGPLCVNRKAL